MKNEEKAEDADKEDVFLPRFQFGMYNALEHTAKHKVLTLEGSEVHVFNAMWNEKGVWFYQAFNAAIADWAVEHQRFGGPLFKPLRMTWVR